MAGSIDKDPASRRRYGVARLDAWIRAGFLPDEANELRAAGIKIRSPLFRRMRRRRQRDIRDIRRAGITDPDQIERILDQFWLARPGNVWDFIDSHYNINQEAA